MQSYSNKISYSKTIQEKSRCFELAREVSTNLITLYITSYVLENKKNYKGSLYSLYNFEKATFTGIFLNI